MFEADPEVGVHDGCFDCDSGFICVDNVCVKDENSKPVDENNDKMMITSLLRTTMVQGPRYC